MPPIARPLILLAAVVGVLFPESASAQFPQPLGPHMPWRTVELDRFVVHYPSAAEAWTRPVIARMEAMHERVAELVGFAPESRVTVVVADPYNLANGFAIPFLNRPITVLWTTPPDPRAGISEHRGWGELLFVHEFAHLAHMTVPPRNPWDRLRFSFAPVRIGPITSRSPRWVVEGYATYVEGRLTGSGRPHGTTRPAFLRVRALEGRLPTYGGLSAGGGYQDMASAYLVGSSYLEWLVDRRGDEASLNHVWRRLSARQRRSFSSAFSGVFGGPPEELYGRFAVDLTEKAIEARRLLEWAGLEEGELFQLRRWGTGDPAISPDGKLMAVELMSRDLPSRLVVWRIEEDPEARQRAEEARRRMLERDTLDVAAVEWAPSPRQPVATLHPHRLRPHRHPRFMPDGKHILLVRWEPQWDGTLRPDLFLWNFETGSRRRITRGAGIRAADPSPDGTHAAGVRCSWGICDLVRVDLGTGHVTVLAEGSPDVVYYRPRYSPNGRTVVAAVQREDRWRLVAVPAEGGAPRYVDPDDGADRYDAVFLPGGDALVAVSTLGGVANLERIDLETGRVWPLTRVLGQVAAPEPSRDDGRIYFLNLHSRGWDVRRVHPERVMVGEVIHLPEDLWPAAPHVPAQAVDPFREAPVPPARRYGLGPQRLSLLPAGSWGADRGVGMLSLAMGDPVGRFSAVLSGAYGWPTPWHGVGLSAAVRAMPVHVSGDAFFARQHLSGGRTAVHPLDVDYAGGGLSLALGGDAVSARIMLRIGGSLGRLDQPDFGSTARMVAFAEGNTLYRFRRGKLVTEISGDHHGAVGRTGGAWWTRTLMSVSLGARVGSNGFRLAGVSGRTSSSAPLFELFQVGGSPALFLDPALLSQRVAVPGLPTGTLSGSEVWLGRLTITTGLADLYAMGVTTRAIDRGWHRVVGIERSVTLSQMPFVPLPAVETVVGVSRSLDEPYRNRTRGYFSIRFRP